MPVTWTAPPANVDLEPEEVHVWRAELTFEGALEELDDRERERAARFRFEKDRRRFLSAHSALRRILSPYAGSAPAALRFQVAAHGKPSIPGPVRFSMSHSGELALYAVALREVGVDVERHRTDIEAAQLAARFFPEAEARELAAADAGGREAVFFRLWTRREAYLKARGIGIAGIRQAAGPEWFLARLDAGAGYAGALACERPEPRIRTWAYTHDCTASAGRVTL